MLKAHTVRPIDTQRSSHQDNAPQWSSVAVQEDIAISTPSYGVTYHKRVWISHEIRLIYNKDTSPLLGRYMGHPSLSACWSASCSFPGNKTQWISRAWLGLAGLHHLSHGDTEEENIPMKTFLWTVGQTGCTVFSKQPQSAAAIAKTKRQSNMRNLWAFPPHPLARTHFSTKAVIILTL